MKQLYIIGNGFDIHHGIPSRYSDYRVWLAENDSDLLECLQRFYDVGDKEWWSAFEENLGYPDMDDYIDETAAENYPDFANEEFRDRDYHAGEITAEDEIGKLVSDIKDSFQDWVNSLPAPNADKRIAINREGAFFINFNYTNTLQTLYAIDPANILFIHGNVAYGTELVLGHNRTHEELDEAFSPDLPSPPDGLDGMELAEWHEMNEDSGEDFIHSSVRKAVVEQIDSIRKNTQRIIYQNQHTFDRLRDTETVYIYGLSFSPIDQPYLDEVVSKVNKATTRWIVSYYSEEDRMNAQHFFYTKSIQKNLVSYVKLEDLLLIRQGELSFSS